MKIIPSDKFLDEEEKIAKMLNINHIDISITQNKMIILVRSLTEIEIDSLWEMGWKITGVQMATNLRDMIKLDFQRIP